MIGAIVSYKEYFLMRVDEIWWRLMNTSWTASGQVQLTWIRNLPYCSIESFIWPRSLSKLDKRIMTKLNCIVHNQQPWLVSFRLCAKPQTDERMQPNCVTWWIDSSDYNLTCRAARRSYDVCKTMSEKTKQCIPDSRMPFQPGGLDGIMCLSGRSTHE